MKIRLKRQHRFRVGDTIRLKGLPYHVRSVDGAVLTLAPFTPAELKRDFEARHDPKTGEMSDWLRRMMNVASAFDHAKRGPV